MGPGHLLQRLSTSMCKDWKEWSGALRPFACHFSGEDLATSGCLSCAKSLPVSGGIPPAVACHVLVWRSNSRRLPSI